MYKNILTAVDGSAHGAAVLDAVSSLAKLTGGRVHVIHIRPSAIIAGGLTGGTVVPVEETAEGRQIVDEAVARLRADGVTADGEVDEGLRQDLASILVERAEALGSDLYRGRAPATTAAYPPCCTRASARAWRRPRRSPCCSCTARPEPRSGVPART